MSNERITTQEQQDVNSSRLNAVLKTTRIKALPFYSGGDLYGFASSMNSAITDNWNRVRQLFEEGGIISLDGEIILTSELAKMPNTHRGEPIAGSKIRVAISPETKSSLYLKTNSDEQVVIMRKMNHGPKKADTILNGIEKSFRRTLEGLEETAGELVDAAGPRNIALNSILETIGAQNTPNS